MTASGRARPRVAVLDYDAGNTRSAKRGFDAAGGDAQVTADTDEADRADVLVVPGVGHWASCLARMRASGLVALLETWITSARPVFGICVGMQLLYATSDEGDEPGLGLLPGRVERFPRTAVVPHIGWDLLWPAAGRDHDPLLDGVAGERVYFVHSYYGVPRDQDHVVARCRYGGVEVPALVREGNVVGTQFHPEKSGEVGRRLLANWLAQVALTSEGAR